MTTAILGVADPAKMRLLAALVRDPNLIHLEGDHPVNQGPILMAWLIERAIGEAGPGARLTTFTVRFRSRVVAGDRVDGTLDGDPDDPSTLRLRATVRGKVVAEASAQFATGGR